MHILTFQMIIYLITEVKCNNFLKRKKQANKETKKIKTNNIVILYFFLL